MANFKKTMMAAAGAAGGAGLDVDEVFSTYLYTGTGSTRAISNGIDLNGEGGLVWIKSRDAGSTHNLANTNSGAGKYLASNQTWSEVTNGNGINSFNSNGFSVGSEGDVNRSGQNFTSWTFRKAPKFFDVVTFNTGATTNTNVRVSHNLGSVPGCIIIKRRDGGSDWVVWHNSLASATNSSLNLNLNSSVTTRTNTWGTSGPTSTDFGLDNTYFGTNVSLVAYVFAHNNGDGEFGPDGDQDIIKCGGWSSSGSHTANLGFEPQWLMIKPSSQNANWVIYDVMRGQVVGGTAKELYPNATNSEGSGGLFASVNPLPTGFSVTSGNTADHIYIAIRRGPLFPPANGTDVFDMDFGGQTSPTPPLWSAGFSPDFALERQGYQSPADNFLVSRLTQGQILVSNNAFAPINDGNWPWFDIQNGVSKYGYSIPSWYAAMWRRAPNFFDVTTYTGTGSSSITVNHSLGVVPEMIWVRRRSGTSQGKVYHKDLTNTNSFLYINSDAGEVSNQSNVWPTAPTDTQITIGNYTGDYTGGGDTGIAFLFASLDGVSKVGSYSGNGSSQTIDCGFSAGARFVLIKRRNGTGGWLYYDTLRGISAGDDQRLRLDSTAYAADTDAIDVHSSGFIVNNDGAMTNASGHTYIFYAIA